MSQVTSNFACLEAYDGQLVRLGMLAEVYFPEDPNTSILKLRQLTELLAQLVATRVGSLAATRDSLVTSAQEFVTAEAMRLGRLRI